MCILFTSENLRALRFKSSYVFLKHLQCKSRVYDVGGTPMNLTRWTEEWVSVLTTRIYVRVPVIISPSGIIVSTCFLMFSHFQYV